MSDCCDTSSSCTDSTIKRQLPCPACSKSGQVVSMRTMLQHIADVWHYKIEDTPYYFCRTPSCDVTYFSARGAVITKDSIRTPIGIKETDEDALLCYCFGVSRKDAQQDATSKQFVISQTRLGNCACETANPSGRCCLKDFPKSH